MRRIECLSQIIAEFGGVNAELQALGITDDEDAWSRYAFKLATGAGKTKVMSLWIVWSYFHALRESDSEMARHFVVIAPNLTVYERLKDDFGNGRVFVEDPLISPEWRGDWNLWCCDWDSGSAWNKAIRTLHETILARSGCKLVAQLDFSTTPKDNKGLLFKHLVCDTPPGEAVDAGIVKTPLIGQASRKLVEQADDNAAYRWEQHLLLGYETLES